MKLLLPLILSCSALSFTSTQAAAETKAVGHQTQKSSGKLDETYTNKETGYSISYPKTWQKKEVPQLDLALIAPKSPNENMSASMNLISQKVNPEVTLAQFYDESVKQLKTQLKEFKVVQSGDKKLGNATAKWILYTHEIENIPLKVAQYFLISSNTMYLITFSTLEKDFDKYKHDFDAILDSFKLDQASKFSKEAKKT